MSETEVKKLSDVEVEERVLLQLTNEQSDPYTYRGFKFVFKRPEYKNKFKGRRWATAKIKEQTTEGEEEDPDIGFYFRFFGTTCNYVHQVFKIVAGEDGKNTYVEYKFDPATELDYMFVFEKFIVDEVYGKITDDEEEFVFEVAKLQTQWLESQKVSESDIKNS